MNACIPLHSLRRGTVIKKKIFFFYKSILACAGGALKLVLIIKVSTMYGKIHVKETRLKKNSIIKIINIKGFIKACVR